MRRLLFIAFILLFSVTDLAAQAYELHNGDTINKVVSGRRQGQWIVKADPLKDFDFKEGAVIEEGVYNNSRKEGLWKTYYPNGKLKSEITYERGRPKGAYTLYYDNGKIEEQGDWERTKNTGDFKRYYTNGKTQQDFHFTAEGKRTGEQKYYYENGNLRLEGTWNDGQETGEMREYYENGDLMSVKKFNNGVLDKESVQVYAPKSPQQDPLEREIEESGTDLKVTAGKEEKPNQGGFDGNGYKKLFNRNKQIAKDGTFLNYRLMDGKQYIYDDDGILQKIMIFKGGRYVGNGVIEEI